MNARYLLLASIAALSAMSSAPAQTLGAGVEIEGDTSLAASTGTVTTVAIGPATSAASITGSIIGTHSGGSAKASGSTGSQTVLALGAGSRAKVVVGSVVGARTNGSVSATGRAKTAVALAFRPGTSVCVAVGSVGPGGRRASGAVGTALVYDFGLFRRTRLRVGTSGAVC